MDNKQEEKDKIIKYPEIEEKPLKIEETKEEYGDVYDELDEALKELKVIEKEIKEGKRKGYKNVHEMFKALDEDIENGRI